MPQTNRTKVLWAAWTDMPAGWCIKEHKHLYYHLFYTISGKGTILIDRKPYQMNGGSLFIISPGTLHEFQAEGHTLLTFYEVKFTVEDERIRELMQKQGVLIRDECRFFETLLRFVALNWTHNDSASVEDIDCFMSTLLISLGVAVPDEISRQSSYIITDGYNELTQEIVSYIEQNHTEQFRLHALAEATGYNPNYLCSVFKQNTGVSIVDYLNHVRVRHATSCFFYSNTSSVPVSAICQYVGFLTPSHFNRVFKKLTGITPGRFRDLYSGMNAERTDLDVPMANDTFSKLYEETLGIKVMPLEKAIENLQRLGVAALLAEQGH